MSRLVFAFMWLLRLLPARVIARVGEAIGGVMFWLIPERRHVTRVNLEKCFPQMDPAQRERLARAHFRAFIRSFLERGILWWSSRERIKRLVRLEGFSNLTAVLEANKPVLVFAPHFVGLDAAMVRLTFELPMAATYSRQKDPVFDRLLHKGRARFGARLFPRQAGLRKALRAMGEGVPYYYLPDLDFGRNRAMFVPFFGVPAATITGLSHLARLAGAAVVPCVTRMLPEGGYATRLYPAWTDFPSGEDARALEADTRRMLAFVEARVLEMPEQYFWLHKRFKTRPEGEQRFY